MIEMNGLLGSLVAIIWIALVLMDVKLWSRHPDQKRLAIGLHLLILVLFGLSLAKIEIPNPLDLMR